MIAYQSAMNDITHCSRHGGLNKIVCQFKAVTRFDVLFYFHCFLISFYITMDAATILTTFFPQLQFDRKNGWLKQIWCINKDSLSQSRFKLPARICLSWYFYQVSLIRTRCRYCYPFLPLCWWSVCLPRSACSSYVGFDFGWLLFLRYSQTSNISRNES